ncbi:MAG TPA: UTP--glucose-1-phosphate uridylyltransferase [Lacipirellula sp.]
MSVIDKQQLEQRLAPHNQQHLLRFWDELDDAGRAKLAKQIQSVDLDLIHSLYQGNVDQPDWAELARRAEPPTAVRLSDRANANGKTPLGFTPSEARQRGVAALRAGEIGVLLTAGGQGSRLGFDKPKSMYPIGPISKATLAQIHIEKVRRAAERYGKPVPLYLMTSPVTHDDTASFLNENNRFGLAEDDLFVFCQGTMPAVDAKTGRLLLEAKDSLFLSPDGHGGTVAALEKTGAIEHMRRRGIKHLFYLQVDNPLAPVCDAELIGYHLLTNSELTSLAVAKQEPRDKLGNFVMLDGRLNVIEYSDFPDDVAERREGGDSRPSSDPRPLRFWAGSVAIHVFDVDFLARSLKLKDRLPFHIAHKKAEYIDDSGQLVEPKEPNALKFERFIFDLLPHAERPIVIEYAEEESFAPLKNAPGAPKDTPEYVHRFMLAQHRRWLQAAGAEVADGADVEISPLAALDAEDLSQQLAGKPLQIDKTTYLTRENGGRLSSIASGPSASPKLSKS